MICDWEYDKSFSHNDYFGFVYVALVNVEDISHRIIDSFPRILE